jgi:hypothetical protein
LKGCYHPQDLAQNKDSDILSASFLPDGVHLVIGC